MEHPNPAVESGQAYDQGDIEALFDTGFGYRISGINVRNDDDGDRFVLLFAKEGGPYNDNISTGEFSYVGEGLPEKGDQSTDSLGNAALIQAESESVPIYFFHQGEHDNGWVYQGLVDVADHELVHDGDRKVLKFTMHHREESAGPEETVQQTSSQPESTAGTKVTETRAGVRISEAFKQQVYDRFDNRCVLTEITRRELLTVSHVLDRASYPNIAEDPTNTLLLNWTHHFAFDADLWTFDAAGQLWVNPDYNPDNECMHESLKSRNGETIEALRDAGIADDYLAKRNESLEWSLPN